MQESQKSCLEFSVDYRKKYEWFNTDPKYEKFVEWIPKASEFMENLVSSPNEAKATMVPQIQTPLFV